MKSRGVPEPSVPEETYKRERDAMVASKEGIDQLFEACIFEMRQRELM
jgi:hypothetical protein